MRPVTPEELDRVCAALDRFGSGPSDRILEDHDAEFWVHEGDAGPPTLRLVGRTLAQALRHVARPAPVAGLELGALTENGVLWGLEGAFEIGRRAKKNRVRVNEKGAQLFLYGKEILGESLEGHDPELRPGGVALVLNRRGETLGLARLKRALPARGPVLEPVLDRGWYLREGG